MSKVQLMVEDSDGLIDSVLESEPDDDKSREHESSMEEDRFKRVDEP